MSTTAPVKTKLKRQPCEVYSRVCGYMRPVAHWNDAKKAEFHDRLVFKTGV
jgi:ribonucleoside-triphosphate reductase